jgi:anti-sigma regulatory factor (Ser/Thr protein kinase)
MRNLEPLIHLEEPHLVALDMGALVNVCPTSLALLTAVAVQLTQKRLLEPGSMVLPPRSPLTRNYLMRMDLLKHLTGEDVPEPFARRDAVGFRPCQQFQTADDYPAVAGSLTKALAERCQTDRVARNSVRIALDEIAENVVHHAESPIGGFAAAQGWPRRGVFEIGIVDMGIGIQASLTKNPDHADVTDDLDAIRTALEPHVTSTPDRNSGIGLFVTRLLLASNGGTLAVRSGRGAVYTGLRDRFVLRDVSFPGTMVALRARTDRPLNINEVYRQLPDEPNAGNHDDQAG